MTDQMKVCCPVCESPNDAHKCVDGGESMPTDGDVSLCVSCGHLARYADMSTSPKLIVIPDEDLKELMSEPDIQKALAIGRAISSAHHGG